VELLERAKQQRWYHTLELGPGHVTDGWFDLRPAVRHYGLPADMTGLTALEIGTWDGFWAFEMERRGAQVTALDLDDERTLDWPPRRRHEAATGVRRGDGFRLAAEILGSSVERVELSVYNATPERLGGPFDVVLCGSVLIHLRDQLLALERIAELTKTTAIVAEEYSRAADLVPFPVARYKADGPGTVVFWQPSRRTWRRLLWTAGFDRVDEHARFTMRTTDGARIRHVVLHGAKR
jgi:tRNA (mo5U34)-methyltransferase